MDSIVKRYVEDGNAVNIDLGFIPEKVSILQNIAGANPNEYVWNKAMEDEATAQYGIKINGSDGVRTELTTAATGIVKLDIKYEGVQVPSPDGGEDQFRVPTVFATATDYSGGTFAARTASVAGSIVRPTVRNGFVYELKTATGAGTTEPTWGTVVGGDTTDGGSNVWTCRTEVVFTKGAQGITVGATSQTDSQVSYVTGYKNIHYVNAGDAGDVGAGDFI